MLLLFIACEREAGRKAVPAGEPSTPRALQDKVSNDIIGENEGTHQAPESVLERFVDKVVFSKAPSDDTIDYYIPLSNIPVKDEILIEHVAPRNTRSVKQAPIPSREVNPLPRIRKMGLSEERYLSIVFDNDIFSNTDYYYTNGLSFEFFHPTLRVLPTSHLLPAAGQGSTNHYSMSLTQTLFTPEDPDKTDIQQGDRPFASYLVLGHSNISINAERRTRITSRLDLGIIGPSALGGVVQKTIHDIEPVGWQNQVSDDFVLNYFIEYRKGIALNSFTEVTGNLSASAGTLYTNASAGGSIRMSNSKGYFESAFLTQALHHKKNAPAYYVMLTVQGMLVGYDATLQGGLFSGQKNIYVIPAQDISRAVFHGTISAGLNFRWFTLELEHRFLTPEFTGGRNFMWSRIKTSFRI